MLSIQDKEAALKLKKMIKAIVPILDFRIYGSCARGESNFESDLDIFIEVNSISKELRTMIYELASEVGYENNKVITTFVVTKDQISKGALAASPILSKIESEGIQI